MKNLILTILLIFSLLLAIHTNAQKTSVIDYQNWSGASGCNIFSGSSNGIINYGIQVTLKYTCLGTNILSPKTNTYNRDFEKTIQ